MIPEIPPNSKKLNQLSTIINCLKICIITKINEALNNISKTGLKKVVLETLRNLDKKYAQAIANYLLKRIETDECLKEKLESTDKTLKGCVQYCKAEAQKQAEDGVAIIEDSQVYEWCVHYFLEDSLNNEPKKADNKTKAKEEKEQVSEEDEVEETEKVDTLFGEEEVVKEKKKTTSKASKPKKDVKEDFKEQLTLFDF
jgi:hypothetical protein